MNYFVNVEIESEANGMLFCRYKLYSGQSRDEIAKMIIHNVKIWTRNKKAVLDLDRLNYKDNFTNLSLAIEEIVKDTIIDDEEEYLDHYSLTISEPYTNLENAVQFYKDYMKKVDAESADYEDMEFNFYGEYIRSLEKIFPYLSSMTKYPVKITNTGLDRIIKIFS